METTELIKHEANSVLNRAREIVVTSDEEYSEAGEFIMGCKALIARIETAHKIPKRATYDAWKAAVAFETSQLEPVQEAMKLAGDVALEYKREQDRLAKEEAGRIAADKRKEEEEKRLKEAERLEAEGKSKEAEQLLDAPPPPTPRPTRFMSPTPKVAGLSTQKRWKGRIVNPDAVTINYRLPDATLINRKVQAFFNLVRNPTTAQIQQLEAEIGGVVIEQEESFAGKVAR